MVSHYTRRSKRLGSIESVWNPWVGIHGIHPPAEGPQSVTVTLLGKLSNDCESMAMEIVDLYTHYSNGDLNHSHVTVHQRDIIVDLPMKHVVIFRRKMMKYANVYQRVSIYFIIKIALKHVGSYTINTVESDHFLG